MIVARGAGGRPYWGRSLRMILTPGPISLSHDVSVHAARTRARRIRAWLDESRTLNVGCVIVRDGRIVGEGATQPVGGAHAEVMALRQAGDAARGATAWRM